MSDYGSQKAYDVRVLHLSIGKVNNNDQDPLALRVIIWMSGQPSNSCSSITWHNTQSDQNDQPVSYYRDSTLTRAHDNYITEVNYKNMNNTYNVRTLQFPLLSWEVVLDFHNHTYTYTYTCKCMSESSQANVHNTQYTTHHANKVSYSS